MGCTTIELNWRIGRFSNPCKLSRAVSQLTFCLDKVAFTRGVEESLYKSGASMTWNWQQRETSQSQAYYWVEPTMRSKRIYWQARFSCGVMFVIEGYEISFNQISNPENDMSNMIHHTKLSKSLFTSSSSNINPSRTISPNSPTVPQ